MKVNKLDAKGGVRSQFPVTGNEYATWSNCDIFIVFADEMNPLGLFHLYSLMDFGTLIRDIQKKSGVPTLIELNFHDFKGTKNAQSVQLWAMEEGLAPLV